MINSNALFAAEIKPSGKKGIVTGAGAAI